MKTDQYSNGRSSDDDNHYSNKVEKDEWQPENGQDEPSQGGENKDFRERNTRYRNHVKGYRVKLNYDREHVFRESGSIDEHLNKSVPGQREKNW